MEIIPMSKKELNQIEIFEKLKNREMPQRAGGEELAKSIRQVKKKLAKYKIFGAESLIHANRGRPSKRKIDLLKNRRNISLDEN